MAVRIILMLSVFLGAYFYVFFRLWHLIPAGNIVRPLLIVVAVLLVLSLVAGLMGGYFLPSPVVSVVYKIGTACFFIIIYLLLIFLLLDLLRLVFPMKTILYHNWLTIGILFGFIAVIFSFGYIHYTQKTRVELPVAIMAKKFLPLRIVAISDLHLGYSIGKTELDEWVEIINAEKPDIVLIAGDIKDNLTKPLLEQKMDVSFRKIKTKYGVYTVLGNHEYIGDTTQISQMLAFMQSAGITVLRDSATLINDEFYLIGRDDRTNEKRKPIAELVQSLDRSKPIILLDHQPFHLEEAEQNGIDLQFSGHTHHGQIFPISLITNLMYEQSHGYLRKGDTHIYVSSGIGIWGGKFRIGTQSEYVVIDLISNFSTRN
ncbi:MAG: metallophosphoesterase [Dysgonamonadaceae bacterium]|jgi:predicted MPP superfamily phosphohydrolase|nr:metallophosphoesterase [Dysgonamonadaceae bacterium]